MRNRVASPLAIASPDLSKPVTVMSTREISGPELRSTAPHVMNSLSALGPHPNSVTVMDPSRARASSVIEGVTLGVGEGVGEGVAVVGEAEGVGDARGALDVGETLGALSVGDVEPELQLLTTRTREARQANPEVRNMSRSFRRCGRATDISRRHRLRM